MPQGLHVGCCGFPVARDRYFPEFDAVEITQTATRLPRLETVKRWRGEAPKGFRFSVRAPRTLAAGAHPFRAVDRRFREVLETIEPAFVVYDTPATYYPSADHMRAMYDYFKGPGRGPWRSVWIPRGRQFDDRLKTRICTDLKIMLGADALHAPDAPHEIRYWRMSGHRDGGRIARGVSFSDGELRGVMERCAGGRDAFLFFDNAAMWRDAKRMKKLATFGRL